MEEQNTNILVDKFKSVFKTTNVIFSNRGKLEHSYIPDEIIARDKQLLKISSNLQPILDLSAPTNMFITGENGVGKTITVQYVFNMLNAGIMTMDQDIVIDFIEINCTNVKTDSDVCRVIATYFELDFNPKGYSISESMHKIWDHINNKAANHDFYSVVFFFDEIDKLTSSKNVDPKTSEIQLDILYQISRAIETRLVKVSNCKVGIITASNKPYFIQRLDSSIRSSVGFYTITFPNYKEKDLYHIMIDRIDAFKPGVLDEQLVHYVAKDIADRYRGDARRAIDTLKEAGKIAFDLGDNKIEMKHVLDAEERITRMASEKMLSEYSSHDKYLFLAIDLCSKLNVSPNTGLIYNVYKQICILLNEKPTTFGYVSGVLSVLVEKCLLNAERGFRGNTRIFTLSDEVKNALHILYTPELKQVIDKNLIDLEILINESQKPKKSKNIPINKYK